MQQCLIVTDEGFSFCGFLRWPPLYYTVVEGVFPGGPSEAFPASKVGMFESLVAPFIMV